MTTSSTPIHETLRGHLAAEADHDHEAAASFYVSDGWYEHQAFGLRFDGRDAVAYQYGASYEAMPDLEFHLEDEIVADNKIVQIGRFTATLTGSLLGLEATGRHLDVPMVAVFTFRDDLIESERLIFDRAEYADQAGIPLADLEAAVGLDTASRRSRAAVETYAAAKSAADIGGALAQTTPDFALHTPALRSTLQGDKEARLGLEVWFAVFPDYSVALDSISADPISASCAGTFSATMTGDLGAIKATNKSFSLPFVCQFGVRNGKLTREDFHFDARDFAEQLGFEANQLGREVDG